MSGGPTKTDWSETGRPPARAPGGGGGGEPGADPCDIVSHTNLNSPDPAVIRTLRPGDKLDVHLQAGPPRILQARNTAGLVAGSITSPEMPRIIDCMRQGVIFVADVVSVRGGVCQVRVHR